MRKKTFTPPPHMRRRSAMGTLSAHALGIMLLGMATAVTAQPAQEVEEIVVVGSQIRGASISDALPVSVMNAEDIEAFGVQSGDELLEYMAEQGQNFFSESENISGGVNSARGDIGAFNLRNLGTGNTLVLLNGRRMVNAASYQTEEVGGSFVPVNTVNAQSLPVTGLRSAEVLKDGASAIYGADAVAGVINYVLRDDFDGLRLRARLDDYESIPRQDQRLTVEWGTNFNNGNTNVGAFLNYFARDRVNSSHDPRWANSDFRYRAPGNYSLDGSSNVFRNTSTDSSFGQFDIRGGDFESLNLTDGSGEFDTFPAGHDECEYEITEEVCGRVDASGTYRANLNANRDLYSDLERINLFAYVNHDFGNGIEGFGELTYYWSDTNTIRHASTRLSAVAKERMAAGNPYNPFGACGSVGRLSSLPTSGDTCDGYVLELDEYRYEYAPRIVDVDGEVWRLVAGLQGELGEWDWEGAVTYSKADRHDVTHNRISNTLLQEGLNDTTEAAINPFGQTLESSNITRALVDVTRDNEQELTMVDFKLSNPGIYEMPSGPVAALIGVEYRDESFVDDRDPRLDGTIAFTDFAGNTFPYVSDIMNSSPTSDSKGDRQITSLFGELLIPVFSSLDMQLAARYEDFSDVGSTTVSRVALGWRPFEPILFRASWSETFRAPNLITINEATVSRSNTRDDPACFYADPEEDTLDCRHGIQRTVQGSRTLKPETSDNYSLGFVFQPLENFTLTFDSWGIEKENTIGLFGEENHIALDLLRRIQAGTGDCANYVPSPAVIRNPLSEADDSDDRARLFMAAGICPDGEVQRVDDQYANLDTRIVEGFDIGVYWDFDVLGGNLDLRYLGSWLREYEQEATGDAALLLAAKESGVLEEVPLEGFGDLRGIDGNPERKHTLRVTWDRDAWRARVSGLYYDSFVQVLSDGEEFHISAMETWNASVDYNFLLSDMESRVRFGINNLRDERAPLADDSFGYFADQHRDLGRYYYVDFQLRVQ